MTNMIKGLYENSYREGDLLISSIEFDELGGVFTVNDHGDRLLVLNRNISKERKKHIISIAKTTKEDLICFKKEGSARRQA